MSIQGISLTETIDYISDGDDCNSEMEGATIFQLGALSADVKAKIQDRMMIMKQTSDGDTEFQVSQGSRNLEALRHGLKGWKNFKDKDGNDISFITVDVIVNGKTYPCISDVSINVLPGFLVTELGEEVLKRNSMTDALRKNLNGELSQ